MSLWEKEEQLLTDLGLTCLQAKLYLFLIRSGPAPAKALSECSKISRPEIYRVIQELIDLGLVQKIIGAPTKFEALKLLDAVDLLLERGKERIHDIERKAKKLGNILENSKELANFSNYHFIVIPKNASREKSSALLESGIKELDLFVTLRKFTPWIFSVEGKLKRALKKNAKIRFIIEKPTQNSPVYKIIDSLEKAGSFQIRYLQEEILTPFLTVDNSEIFFSLEPTSATIFPLLQTNHSVLKELAKKYFDIVWLRLGEGR
jgi:sugar-specific transcriptional regulator TrmB